MWHNLGQLLRYRGLIQSLVVRDLKARYRGSVLGFFWSFINPLLLLIVYSVVFTYFMKRPGADAAHPDELRGPYAVFLFCGLLPWTWFTTALLESAGSLIVSGNLIKKVLFPAEVLPIVSVLASMVHFVLGLPILAAFLIYYEFIDPSAFIQLHPAELIWFPVVVLVQLIFTAGLALLLSSLTVHYRDIKDLLGNLLTFWFFLTPIIYSYKTGPIATHWLNLNPFFHLVASYQEILYFPENAFGHKAWLLALGAASIAFFVGAYWVFDRLRDSFAEAV
jgi:ABC-type polysaccharide/polyol phosphate export permease